MNIELRHLRTIVAIHTTGSVAKAAQSLNTTQSALSHQLRVIRTQLGVDPFEANVKPLRLSPEGLRLLEAAQRILPEIENLQIEFDQLRVGNAGRLHIAIECHACYEWLFPVLKAFRLDFPDVDIDIRPGLSFRALKALGDGEIDVVISSDPEESPDLSFCPLFDYSPTLILARANPLSDKPFVEAGDFVDQTLITYPVERSRLDVFSQLLMPAGVEPRIVRQVELTDVILLLVDANKGISVLPDWVVRTVQTDTSLVTRPLTAQGISRSLFAAVQKQTREKPYMKRFIDLAKTGQSFAKQSS